MELLRIKNLTQINDVDDYTPIYRYFSYKKIYQALKDKNLWFSNIDKFSDKKERQFPPNFFYGWSQEQEESYRYISTMKNSIVHAYVSCWTKSKDNYAFWKIYNKENDGCMIATTVGKIKDQLNKSNYNIYEVEYPSIKKRVVTPQILLYKCADQAPICFNVNEKYKIRPYEFEKEIRFVFYSFDEKCGYKQSIEFEKLIDYVTISPFANNKSEQRLKKTFDKYLPGVKIKLSEIDEK